jgi:hypothetical protein
MKNKYLQLIVLLIISLTVMGISGCDKINDTINFISVVFFTIIIFGVYFSFKVIGFVLSATKLYKTIIQREEQIIRILLEIRDRKEYNDNMIRDYLSTQQK